MGMWSDLRRALSPIEQPDVGGWNARALAIREQQPQTRAIDSFTSMPGLEAQLLAVQGLASRPWRVASIREALGVPSFFRSVALISNTVGMLAMEAYRKGVLLSDDDTPRLIKRPDPFRIPRDFYRDTAYDMATRGEYWWWAAKRDIDDSVLSLIRVAPWEIKVEQTGDRLRPRILWGNEEMPRRDMFHGTLQPDPNSQSGPYQRGVGPLQLCGAAVSVAVESDQWAANFFGEDGGYPSIVIKAAGELGEGEDGVNEADTLRDQWMSKPHNTPRVVDDSVEDIKEFGANAVGSQMLDAREHNKGDAANMWGIPGALLEYGRPGSSLTYQAIADVFTTFLKTALQPDYLEPIEQQMSDLLTRSTVARFNVDAVNRADVKTRFEVYKLGIESGVMTPEQAAQQEGIIPGDVEFAPVPFAPPQAVPDVIPTTRANDLEGGRYPQIRCDGKRIIKGVIRPCNKLLSTTGTFVGRCDRCGKEHTSVA